MLEVDTPESPWSKSVYTIGDTSRHPEISDVCCDPEVSRSGVDIIVLCNVLKGCGEKSALARLVVTASVLTDPGVTGGSTSAPVAGGSGISSSQAICCRIVVSGAD